MSEAKKCLEERQFYVKYIKKSMMKNHIALYEEYSPDYIPKAGEKVVLTDDSKKEHEFFVVNKKFYLKENYMIIIVNTEENVSPF